MVFAVISLANIKYMLKDNYFATVFDTAPYLHFWSLSVEEQFYVAFPATFLLLYSKAKRQLTLILSLLCLASLVSCIVITHRNPTYGFYLPITRAWELLAGGLVATAGANGISLAKRRPFLLTASLTGLVLIAISVIAIHNDAEFPGYLAILPVLGTVCVLGSAAGAGNWAESVLAKQPLVLIGRMSYSLYLWHWPVFCFVDYRFYLASQLDRVVLKVVITLAATALCFYFIESPGRIYLNTPRRRGVAFAFLACALTIFIPFGMWTRENYYIDAVTANIAKGGLSYPQAAAEGTLVLMGDSNGSMYGKMFKEVAQSRHLSLNVISVLAGHPLPALSGPSSQLWRDSFAFVKSANPSVLVLICNWSDRFNINKESLALAVQQLKQHAGHIILITEPPQLPESASREAIRNGSRPPFIEDAVERAGRLKANELVKSFASKQVTVIDIESLFSEKDGSIRVYDSKGAPQYFDGTHLSEYGVAYVRPYVVKALSEINSAH